MTITDAKNRAEKLSELIDHIESVLTAQDAKEKTTKGRRIINIILSTEFRHNNDPVIWMAALRDLDEMREFINDCKKQEENEIISGCVSPQKYITISHRHLTNPH